MIEDFGLAPCKPKAEKIPKPLRLSGTLKSLNLDAELYDRYIDAKDFLDEILQAEGVPPNQVAQLMNTLTSILKEITKMQTDLYNAERLKKLEYCIIAAVKGADAEIQAKFFEQYETLLNK